MLLYILTTVCRTSGDGYLYYSPSFLPVGFYIFYILNMACNITWVFMYDREYMWASLGVILAVSVTLYIAIGISMRGLYVHSNELIEKHQSGEIRLVIGFIHNCLGLYAAWATIVSLLNLAIVLTYQVDIQQSLSSTLSLSALAFEVVLYACVDMIFFEQHFRFLFTPYMAICVALTGILVKNWDLQTHNTIFEVAIVACSGFLFVVKIGRAIVKERSKPLYEQETVKSA